jgi:uncharacterized protein HemY
VGQAADANTLLERAVALRPRYAAARLALIELALARRDRAAALSHYDALVRLAPQDPLTAQAARLLSTGP